MSQLNSFLTGGFAATAKVIGTTSMTAGAVSRPCLLDSAQATKTLMESGVWQKCTHTAELTRADYQALGLVERKVVTIGGVQYRVMLPDGLDDLADPCVRVHLRLANLPTV